VAFTAKWIVGMEPVGANPGVSTSKNLSGIKVILTDGDESIETERVAFLRENSKFPDLSFEEALNNAYERAMNAADKVNDLNDEAVKVRDKLVKDAKSEIRLALGRPASGTKPS
jgi:hypothetical protein